jgi:hypothetical protein
MVIETLNRREQAMRQFLVVLGACFEIGFFGAGEARADAAPVCDDAFHWVGVGGTVCLDGSSTGFYYRCFAALGPNAPLLLSLDSGGGCWDGETCDCQPDANGGCTNPSSMIIRDAFPDTIDNLSYVRDAVFAQQNYSGATSPFNQSWNQVFVPYCTGDVHAGNAVQTYSTAGGGMLTAHHKGFPNIRLELGAIHSKFPNPERVAAWGSSAGGFGLDCNLFRIRKTWSHVAEMFSMNDAGTTLSAPWVPLVPEAARDWGVWHFDAVGNIVADTCPIAIDDHPNDWSPVHVMRWNRINLKSVRKAFTDDYADFALSAFACLLGADCSDDGAQAMASSIEYAFNSAILGGGDDYRAYLHDGNCHNEREWDDPESTPGCNYDDMTQDGVRFNDWVRGWLEVPGFKKSFRNVTR